MSGVWPFAWPAAERVAIETPAGSLTYPELAARSLAGARELGVARAARVAIALPHGVDFAVAMHACFAAGAVAVPIDLREPQERWPGADLVLDHPLAGTGPAGAVVEPALDDIAAIIRTSGSTGEPKEVALTFANFVWSALGSAVALGLDPRERWLCTLPLSHVGGLSILVRSWLYGTTAVVHERFETEAAVEALMNGGITLVSVVATTLARMLDAGLEHPPALRCALLGGGPVPAALVERARAAGVPVSKTYGLTEACSQVASQAPGSPQDGAPPLFCTRLEIAPDGEILAFGPTISPSAVQPLRTGDLGQLDADRHLHVLGRKADIIISGGENISSIEVEDALYKHPAVQVVAVVAKADEKWGETPCAFVELKPGTTATADELIAWCKGHLAGYKCPRTIVFAEIPKTSTGKIQKFKLREMAKALR